MYLYQTKILNICKYLITNSITKMSWSLVTSSVLITLNSDSSSDAEAFEDYQKKGEYPIIY